MTIEPIPDAPTEFTPLQIIDIVILLATLLSAAAQWDNQFKLHKATPNSYQRKLCLAAASIAVSMSIGFLFLFSIYIADIRAGWPPGRVLPGQRSMQFKICSIFCIIVTYGGSCVIVQASLHRYHRLCSVIKGSRHESYFNVAKYGSIAAAIIAVIANSVNGYIYRSPALVGVLALSMFTLYFIDFYANYSASSNFSYFSS
jgi:uncharacterized membrane protein YidH (DUF202 family)